MISRSVIWALTLATLRPPSGLLSKMKSIASQRSLLFSSCLLMSQPLWRAHVPWQEPKLSECTMVYEGVPTASIPTLTSAPSEVCRSPATLHLSSTRPMSHSGHAAIMMAHEAIRTAARLPGEAEPSMNKCTGLSGLLGKKGKSGHPSDRICMRMLIEPPADSW